MAERFEYDVIRLTRVQAEGDRRCFQWRSRRGGCHAVDHESLEEMLNHLGSAGWQVVSHDTDVAFGSTLILQRRVEEGALKRAPQKGAAAPPTPPTPVDLAPVVAEIQALRAQLAQQPAPQVMVQPTPVHVAAPTVNYEGVRPHLEAILAALKQIEAGQPVAVRAVERLIEEALAPQPAVTVEPKFEPRRSRWFGWTWSLGR